MAEAFGEQPDLGPPGSTQDRAPVRASISKSLLISPPKDPSHDEILTLARKRFRTVSDTESQLRVEQQIDMRFAASDQWPQAILADREMDGRPWLTINRLPVFEIAKTPLAPPKTKEMGRCRCRSAI